MDRVLKFSVQGESFSSSLLSATSIRDSEKMGLESTSWNWLRDGIGKELPHFSLLERVENGVLAGMADVNYVIRGNEGWIEMKAVDLPKRDSTPVLGAECGLNQEQVNWHLRRAQVLGNTWVFISALPFRWLVMGGYAREINQWTRDDLCGRSRFWYDEKWGKLQWAGLINAIAPHERIR